MVDQINSFRGRYSFLSNFHSLSPEYWIPVKVGEKVLYAPTSEHAFMACKTLVPEIRQQILQAETPGIAKRLGKAVTLRPDWEAIKVGLMKACLQKKFMDPQLSSALSATGRTHLLEGNVWHDNYWGACSCEGCANREKSNVLGRLLMEVRESFL